MTHPARSRTLMFVRSALLAGLATPAIAQGTVSAPEIRIGTSESDPRNQFAVVGDAVSLADGRVAVLDAGARIVRLYGRDGHWIRDLGRAGDGPGEYREPVALSVAGTTVIVLDNTGRLLLHPADGRAARTTAVRPEASDDARFRMQVDQPISETQVLLRANERTFGRVRGDYRATTGVLLWSADGAIDTLGWFPADSLRTDASGVPVPRPFAPALGALTATTARHVAVLVPETGLVTVFEVAGRRRTEWATGSAPVVPSSADLERLRDDRLRGLGGNDARVVGEWLDGQPGPARPVVALRMLLADDALWLERPVRVGDRPRWEVFALDGRRRSEVTLPAEFELLEVRGDQLLGIRRNADDVDIVERRRLGTTSGNSAQPRPYFPGALTTVNGLAFAPDGHALYVSHRVAEQDARGRPRARLFRYARDGDGWSAPTPVWRSARHTDYQPVLSPDAQRLYFTSTRPTSADGQEQRQNVWYAEREGTGWSEPEFVPELVSGAWDGYAVPTTSGRLDFVSDRDGGLGAADLWVADPAGDGRYASPRNLRALNSAHTDSDLYVDPAERYLVFHRWLAATATADLWLATGTDGSWRSPRPLWGANGPGLELSPTVSPDGRTLFFQRDGVIQHVALCAVLTTEEREHVSMSCAERTDGAARADSIDAATTAALDTANAAFSAAYLRGDVDALVNAYVPDAILHPPAGGVRLGTAAVRSIWGGGASGRLGHRLEPLLRRQLSDVTVLEMGRWHSRRATADDPDPAWLWGCYTVVWRKDEGAPWRMYYDAWGPPHTEDWACRPRP